jgi:hypothetical protein
MDALLAKKAEELNPKPVQKSHQEEQAKVVPVVAMQPKAKQAQPDEEDEDDDASSSSAAVKSGATTSGKKRAREEADEDEDDEEEEEVEDEDELSDYERNNKRRKVVDGEEDQHKRRRSSPSTSTRRVSSRTCLAKTRTSTTDHRYRARRHGLDPSYTTRRTRRTHTRTRLIGRNYIATIFLLHFFSLLSFPSSLADLCTRVR